MSRKLKNPSPAPRPVTRTEIEMAKQLLVANGYVVIEQARVQTAVAECRLSLDLDDTIIAAEYARQTLAERLCAMVVASKAVTEKSEIEGEFAPCKMMSLDLTVIMPEPTG